MIISTRRNSTILTYLHNLIDYPSKYNPYSTNKLTDDLIEDEKFMFDYLFDLSRYCISPEEFKELSSIDDLYSTSSFYSSHRDIFYSQIAERTGKFIELVYFYKGLKLL